ncbi:oxidoreductase [Paracidovorax konjaci]|uniref:Homoserine dehydrogenase, NAD binding domain n=1 Tax=Paracidovorax konjaci TaxID=32040 RepID=A0A1I1SIX9_9BURK|nr:oxidoreductase [Paracidovorax konjaci]SFD46262.1 Homoserine dehydrogenase, NAD binding domain [Paracidovorax konjaci]
MQTFRIVVIGAGETGTPLLRHLLTAPFVQILGVADLDLSLPGIALARDHGAPVTQDYMELLEHHGPAVDIVIDVTGQASVREALRKHMVETGNQSTVILHERIALLMMSLSAGMLVAGRHGEAAYA